VSTSVAPEWRPTASLATLQARAQALGAIRSFFVTRDVLEVQTPLLGRHGVTDPEIAAYAVLPARLMGPSNPAITRAQQAQAGVLQTSTEYHQKRLLAAGVGDNYTLGPVFRADEQGRLHSPEFTMLEWYRLGFDDRALMAELSELVDLLLGAADYSTHSYSDLVAGVTLSDDERRTVPASAHADLLLTRAIATLGSGRHFIVDYPAEAAVLARLDPVNPAVARRFELVIDGIEVANGYFELTDVATHHDRFVTDQRVREARGLNGVVADDALLAAVAAGLPECAGVALGFDRLLLLMLGAESLAEVQAFGWERR